jgi:hypothetical protein
MRTVRLLLVMLLPLAACAKFQSNSALLTESQTKAVIERAREKVIMGTVVRGANEVVVIRTKEPSFKYYFLSKPYGDYDIRWSVTKEETITVRGRGNILELEGAIVERTKNGT